jgi:hypothetical protein
MLVRRLVCPWYLWHLEPPLFCDHFFPQRKNTASLNSLC